jgi:outer membrane protein assembly factor BamB
MYPHDLKRHRNNPDGDGLPDALAEVEEVWVSEEESNSTPVVTNGTVYVGTEGSVRALNAQTGSLAWEYETGEEVNTSPAVSGSTVYVGVGDRLVALNARTGNEEWSVGLDGAVTTSPVTTEIEVFVGTENRVYSLDVNGGNENWNVETRVDSEMSPAVTDDRVVYADGSLVFAHDRVSGEEIWRGHVGGYMTDITVEGTRVYCSGGSSVHAMRLRNGVGRWSQAIRGEVVGGPVVKGSSLYVATDSGFMYSLDLSSDGWTEWQKEFDSPFRGSPVMVDGVLYGVTLEARKGKLYAVNPSDGEILGEYVLGQEQVEQDPADDEVYGMDIVVNRGPTVGEGYAYVTSESGIHAFGVNDVEPPTASFEMDPRYPSAGEVVSFDASGSTEGGAPIDSYGWSFESEEREFTASVRSFEEVFDSGGDWTVSLTVTDEDGASDKVTEEFSVEGGSGSESSGNGGSGAGTSGEGGSSSGSTSDTDGSRQRILFALGTIGAVVSALGFSAYWRMEPEREKLKRKAEKKGGFCHECGASLRRSDGSCPSCDAE